MKEIIKHIDGGKLLLEVDRHVYDAKAILNASYKFTDKCHIHHEPISDDIVGVYFKAKGNIDVPLGEMADEFCNELIDQQIRLNVEKEYGSIRDKIVKKAFSPIEPIDK